MGVGGGHNAPWLTPKRGVLPSHTPLLLSPPPQIAELEKRLAQLEATVRCEPDSQVRGRGSCPPPPRILPPILPH